MNAYQIGTAVAAAKWFILAIMGFVLPFVLAGQWQLGWLWVPVVAPWALIEAGLCMVMAIRALLRLEDTW